MGHEATHERLQHRQTRHGSVPAKNRKALRATAKSTPRHRPSLGTTVGRHLGRWLTVLGVVLAGSAMVPLLIWVAGSAGSAQSSTASVSTAESQAVARFDRDVRRSLSPMLVHVKALPDTLKGLAAMSSAGAQPDVATLTESWANDSATARDLVGRLTPPAVAEGPEVKRLYVDGTMFYTEAARVAAEAASGPSFRGDLASSGLRLLLLGDRTFDIGRRLLHRYDSAGSEKWEMPAEVPDFAKEGLDPDRAGPVTPGGSGFEAANVPVVADADWLARNATKLEGARRVILEGRSLYDGSGPAAGAELADARGLEAKSRSLAQPVPAGDSAAQGLVAFRLGLLTESESLRALTFGNGDTVTASRLRMIGEQLWTAGAALLDRSDFGEVRARLAMNADLDPGLLLVGGRFNGHPPVLRPGDDPSTGVPGGLPDPHLTGLGR